MLVRYFNGKGLNVALFVWLLCALIAPKAITAQKGTLAEDTFHSRALEGNLSGDSPDRSMYIYLPPSYKKSPTRRYPVIYLLHGYQGSYQQWTPIVDVLNNLIAQGAVREMILVMPDANNKFGGSFYTNSASIGNWEDFLIKDLIAYVDRKYRTLPQAASRGIAGHSMGGYGAIKLGMKRPDLYSAVYGLSSCCLGWGGDLAPENAAWKTTLSFKTMDDLKPKDEIYFAQALMGLSAAWSANPAGAPFFVDFLVDSRNNQRKLSESVYAKWSANMPVAMVDQYRTNLALLRAIAFDVGKQDEFTHIPLTNRELSQALTRNKIKHSFEEYEGDHNNKVPERLVSKLLPFFSQTLEFKAQPSTNIVKSKKLRR
ncbi:MAG: alpha/beta hydrolase [Pyrinomonadaceae bacterium]